MDIEAKQKELEEKFNEHAEVKAKLLEQIKQIEMEQVRLQGEFRLLDEMQKDKKEPKKKIPKEKEN